MLAQVKAKEKFFALVLDETTSRIISSCARLSDLTEAGALGNKFKLELM